MEGKKSLTENELYNIGASMCARTEHCSAEVASRLLRGTDDEDLVARVILRLTEERFIDEERYVRAFVNDKLRFARWGRIKIRHELWRKQVSEKIYAPILQQIDEASYLATLKELLRAKKKTLRGKDTLTQKSSLLRFATSRGFEPSLIYPLIGMDDELM